MSGLISGDPQLQGYISQRYKQLRAAGYSKSEAHAIAFAELREQLANPPQQQQQDPYSYVIYSNEEGF